MVGLGTITPPNTSQARKRVQITLNVCASTKLASGQRVEIISAKSSAPKPQWLEFVVTGKARTSIRQQLKQLEHEDAVQLGHRMLDRALEALDSSLDRVPPKRLDALLAEHRYPRLEAMLADIALGNRMPQQVAIALTRDDDEAARAPKQRLAVSEDRILITGAERGVISFAQCCLPLPGDEIMGYHTAGKGLVVHRLDCPNLADYRKSQVEFIYPDANSTLRITFGQVMGYTKADGTRQAPQTTLEQVAAKATGEEPFDAPQAQLDAIAAKRYAGMVDPELGTGHLAMGYYHYWGKRDYDRARAEFTAALRRRPSDGDALYGLGAVSRRQGRWTEAVASLCGVADLDPRSASKAPAVY